MIWEQTLEFLLLKSVIQRTISSESSTDFEVLQWRQHLTSILYEVLHMLHPRTTNSIISRRRKYFTISP